MNLLSRLITKKIAFKGFDPAKVAFEKLDNMDDHELTLLNSMMPWKAFIVDSKGRRFGNLASSRKRYNPQQIPDKRIELLHELIDLKDKSVLEVGCFEGIHTIGLCLFAKSVTALDARIENVTKSLVRTHVAGFYPEILKIDLENLTPEQMLGLQRDVLFHCGVLYHLSDPIDHLRKISMMAKNVILLDTHFATPEMATSSYMVGGKLYSYSPYKEHGYSDPFSGTKPESKWLKLDDIKDLLMEGGFTDFRVNKVRNERNGPRVLLIACKN